MTEDADVMTAAADAATGAMIALIPTDEDIARLALDGGEGAEQLHCTVLYLGEAADLDEEQRADLIQWAVDTAGMWSAVEGDAFAAALFNPSGDEPCLTLVLSGAELAEFHDTAAHDVRQIIDLVDQHEPYIPHVTLIYMPADLALPLVGDAVQRTGPVTFDRIRLAFAGEITDVMLGSGEIVGAEVDEESINEEQPAPEVVEPEPSPAPVMAASAREVFAGCEHCGSLTHISCQ